MVAKRRVCTYFVLYFVTAAIICSIPVSEASDGDNEFGKEPELERFKRKGANAALQGGGGGGVNVGAPLGGGPQPPAQGVNNMHQQNPQQQVAMQQQKINPDVGAHPNRGGYQQGQPVGLGQSLNKNLKFSPPKKGAPIKIAETQECHDDVARLCSKTVTTANNFQVLDCLQNDVQNSDDVSMECQNLIWNYKRNLTTDVRFDSAAFGVCKDDLKRISECTNLPKGTGQIIPCLIEHKENITDPNCQQFLTKMASIIFSDYRTIWKFAEKCQEDITKLGCGRTEEQDEMKIHNQGRTILCLEKQIERLQEVCKMEVIKVAELQSDDFHNDRQLFLACREDREKLCENVRSGHGKVYKCLRKHKFDEKMSVKCREMITIRQKVAQKDYKVDHSFVDQCREDIRKLRCMSGKLPKNKLSKMSHILLCLESGHRKNLVSPECLTEMVEVRRSLMEDYQLTPGIVSQCGDEINNYCGQGLKRGGKTLHCLMDLARPSQHKAEKYERKISDGCLRELEDLVKETDVAEDILIDPVVVEACRSAIDMLCAKAQEVKDSGELLSCLMEKIEHPNMPDECEEKLMEIQYFAARNFELSVKLYRECHSDAVKLCQADEKWYDPDQPRPENNPLILPCLYNKRDQIVKPCALEIKRVMHQRAVSVDLEPRVEEPCLTDLGRWCSGENVEEGEEIECLQDNLEKLTAGCKEAVMTFTEMEDADVELDHLLMKACSPMLERFCKHEMEADNDVGDVMECLIKHKNSPEMDDKCRVGINHHQVITNQDYNLSFKFKKACEEDVRRVCSRFHTKYDVVSCLSEAVRNDTLLERPQRVGERCTHELNFEMLQRSETIDLDPKLKHKCEDDIMKFCPHVKHGSAKVIECLKMHQAQLSKDCHKKLFKREKEQFENPNTDFQLVETCKDMIQMYCRRANTDPKRLFSCLKKHKNEEDFDEKCRDLVVKRQILQSKDYRLNPILQKACRLDIPKFCKSVLANEQPDTEFEGKVINCLKIPFRKHRLSHECEEQIKLVAKEAALDYRQDPILGKNCKKEINELCHEEVRAVSQGHHQGMVEECLKKNFKLKKIINKECQTEVVRLLAEGKADVHVDPLLFSACSLDLKHYCDEVEPGEGRQMSCLITALQDRTIRLTTRCKKLLQDRVDMWEYAVKVAPPETFADLYDSLIGSPARNYFLGIILAVIMCIFIGGLCCGRVTKRVSAATKNK